MILPDMWYLTPSSMISNRTSACKKGAKISGFLVASVDPSSKHKLRHIFPSCQFFLVLSRYKFLKDRSAFCDDPSEKKSAYVWEAPRGEVEALEFVHSSG